MLAVPSFLLMQAITATSILADVPAMNELTEEAGVEPAILLEKASGLWVWSLAEKNEYAGVSITPHIVEIDSIGWGIECPIDAMSDRRRCSFTFRNPMPGESEWPALFVNYLETNAPQLVCVAGHDHSGKVAMIRVDKNEPVATWENGCIGADDILPELMSGETVTVRAYRYPHNNPDDNRHSLVGFAKTIEVVSRIIDGTLPRSK